MISITAVYQPFDPAGAFKIEVALEDIADQSVAAADPNNLRIESKLIIVDETRYRRYNPIQTILSQPVVNDEAGALGNLWLDVLDPNLTPVHEVLADEPRNAVFASTLKRASSVANAPLLCDIAMVSSTMLARSVSGSIPAMIGWSFRTGPMTPSRRVKVDCDRVNNVILALVQLHCITPKLRVAYHSVTLLGRTVFH